MSDLVKFEFHGDVLDVVPVETRHCVVIRSITDALGVDYSSQLKGTSMARKKNTVVQVVPSPKEATSGKARPNAKPQTPQGKTPPEVGQYGEAPDGRHYLVQEVTDDGASIRYPDGSTELVDYDVWPDYSPWPDIDQQEYRDGYEEELPKGESAPDEVPTIPAADAEERARWAWVDEAIKSRSLERLAATVAEIEAVITELDAELAATKADLGKRLKTARARRSDVIHELEELTHTWVLDDALEVAYLVSKDNAIKLDGLIVSRNGQTEYNREILQREIDALAKKTRPMIPSDRQEALPFAAEG